MLCCMFLNNINAAVKNNMYNTGNIHVTTLHILIYSAIPYAFGTNGTLVIIQTVVRCPRVWTTSLKYAIRFTNVVQNHEIQIRMSNFSVTTVLTGSHLRWLAQFWWAKLILRWLLSVIIMRFVLKMMTLYHQAKPMVFWSRRHYIKKYLLCRICESEIWSYYNNHPAVADTWYRCR